MQKLQAQNIVSETFEKPFEKTRFTRFIKELLNHIEESSFVYRGNLIPDAYEKYISTFERVGKYSDGESKLDILIVNLKKETSLERARTAQRNFIAWYLNGSRGGEMKDAALVAFVSPNDEDWRFSLVKMEYKFTEGKSDKTKVKEEFTPAKRWSFLVGKNENSHTAQSRLAPIIEDDQTNITLKHLEDAFNIEKVTKEFFEKYREIFLKLKESLDEITKKNKKVKEDFKAKDVNTVDFTKKLLGQIVFLYFLQKKGWFGVLRGKDWGEGDKKFLRNLFLQAHQKNKNYFNTFLEPLFYEALRLERPKDYYDQFNCRIPFLNGGLFDPISDYDWQDTDMEIPNDIFSNDHKTKEGDIGDGILDIFDRYNFTVKEDEPLEKEVAVDPEMLGKVFENLLEVKDRKSKGTYYTPREIVRYMCQESLANYLATELENKVSREDIETLIKYGESVVEHDSRVVNEGRETKDYSFKLPQNIRKHAKLIDEKLVSIRVCDPAVGSGAFPVGMMNEVIRTRNALTPYIGKDGERTPYNFKRHAIQSCLYGVDIDPGAVEIAKLRLWLSLIVDEEERETIQPLPNLDYKIVQGNSLLSVEKNSLFISHWMQELEKVKGLYFNETNPRKKQEFKKKIDELIKQITNGHKDFDFEIYFSEVFREKKGFDVVIANPPYLEARSPEFTEQMKDEAQQGAKIRWGNDLEYITRGSDLLIYFFELGIYLLSKRGTLVFITQNSWLDTDYGKKFQNFLLKNTNVKAIIDSDFKYFDSKLGPNINTVIPIFFGKKADEKSVTIFARYHENFEKVKHSILCNKPIHPFSQVEIKKFEYSNPALKNLKWGTLLSSPSDVLQIFSLLKKKGKSLSQLSNHDLSMGQGLNLQKSFVVDEKLLKDFPFIAEHLIPFMGTEDGAPFVLEKTKQFIVDGTLLESSQIKKLKSAGISIFQPSSTGKIKPLLILPRGVSRHFCAMNSAQAYSSSGVDIYDNNGNLSRESALNLWFFLNSSIAWLVREITGRKSLGGGLLKAEATDLREVPIYFDFNKSSDIQKVYERLKKRKALPTVDEIDTGEHKTIDNIVFDYLDVSQKQRNKIVEFLKTHILGRINKSRT